MNEFGVGGFYKLALYNWNLINSAYYHSLMDEFRHVKYSYKFKGNK